MTEISDGIPRKDVTVPAEGMTSEVVGSVSHKNETREGGWKNWLKKFSRSAAITTAVAGPALGLGHQAVEQYQDNVVRHEDGQPVEGATPFPAILVDSGDVNGQVEKPTFWNGATDESEKLSIEDLKKIGIDPNNPEIIDVEGQVYPTAGSKPGEPTLGSHPGKDGKNYGAWGEFVVDGKRTGIFVPGKYIDEKPQEEPQPGE